MRSTSALAASAASACAFLRPLSSLSSTFFSTLAAVMPSCLTAAAVSALASSSWDLYDVTSALTFLSSSATSSKVFCCLAISSSNAAFSLAISSSSSLCLVSSVARASSVSFSDCASLVL